MSNRLQNPVFQQPQHSFGTTTATAASAGGGGGGGAAGVPLPAVDHTSLQRIGAPQCSDWPLTVQHSMPQQQQQQPQQQKPYGSFNNNNLNMTTHALQRGDAIILHQQRGIYLGRPSSTALGNVCYCIMRDNTSGNNNNAVSFGSSTKLVTVDLRSAADQILYLPSNVCNQCGSRIPLDEFDAHRRLMHSNSQQQFSQQQQQQPQPQHHQGQHQMNNLFGPSPNQQQQQQQQFPPPPPQGYQQQNQQQNQNTLHSPVTPQYQTQQQLPPRQPGQPYLAGDHTLLSCLNKIKKLGEGAQGEVWQCTVAPANRMPDMTDRIFQAATPGHLVLKSIKCKDQTIAVNRFEQSVRLMKIRSSHLVSYFCVVYDPTKLEAETRNHVVHVVMPYYAGGNLSQRIAKQKGKFTEQWLLSTVLQLNTALNVLHQTTQEKPFRICHGDVKPDNVLLFGNNDQVLLMDLEASSLIPETQATVKADNDGTFEWRAPESANAMVSTSSDMWSLGCVALVLALLPDFPAIKNPETGGEEMLNSDSWTDSRLYWSVRDSIMSKGYGERTAEIIGSLLRLDPKNRPTTHTLNEVLSQWMESLILSGKFN